MIIDRYVKKKTKLTYFIDIYVGNSIIIIWKYCFLLYAYIDTIYSIPIVIWRYLKQKITVYLTRNNDTATTTSLNLITQSNIVFGALVEFVNILARKPRMAGRGVFCSKRVRILLFASCVAACAYPYIHRDHPSRCMTK